MWGSCGKNYSKYMGYCSTFNADNSAIIHRGPVVSSKPHKSRVNPGLVVISTNRALNNRARILTEKMSFKRYWLEIILSKQKDYIMSKTFTIKISKLHTNSWIKTLGFVWSFEILTTKIVAFNKFFSLFWRYNFHILIFLKTHFSSKSTV